MIMRDGFRTQITLVVAGAPIAPVQFYEKEVKPPGYDAGGKIDTTGMRNSRFRTAAPKSLLTATGITAKVAYDPNIVVNIRNIAGIVGNCIVEFPDGDTVTLSGCWLDKFEPDPHVEGTQPTANITIEVGNSTNGLPDAEVEPVYVAPL